MLTVLCRMLGVMTMVDTLCVSKPYIMEVSPNNDTDLINDMTTTILVPDSYQWKITMQNPSCLIGKTRFIKQWVVLDKDIVDWIQAFHNNISQELINYNNEYYSELLNHNLSEN